VIRTELRVTVRCDRCAVGLTRIPNCPAPAPVVFTDRRDALAAIAGALTPGGGWARLIDGRLLCPVCTTRLVRTVHRHEYAPDGWRMCACDRSLPAHAEAPPDPAGGEGCGMTWRLCGRCDHIDEHHVTDGPDTDEPDPGVSDEVQPGGHLRQDVPAGLALPTPIPHPTSGHKISREIPMVEREHPPGSDRESDTSGDSSGRSCGAVRRPGSRWTCREDAGHDPEHGHRDAMGDRWWPASISATPVGDAR
jgi:hypothetical protein